MNIFRCIVVALCSLLPFGAFALEPIFKIKGDSIILSHNQPTSGVVYDIEALAKNDYSKKYMINKDFAGCQIFVEDVNVINWNKKDQGVILKFSFEGKSYCFYFPQNVKTSHFTKKLPYTRFYTGRYLDMYQNQDDLHFIAPEKIAIIYWRPDEINFMNLSMGKKFKWDKTSKDNYIFERIDLSEGKIYFRPIAENEIKPANISSTNIEPYCTVPTSSPYSNHKLNQILYKLYWDD